VGLILDSSIVIAAERRGHTVRQILEQIKNSYGEIDIGFSVITIAELIHGAYRAKTGVTALQLGFDVASLNLRHFQLIPSLKALSQ
jgi:predicted nucleic acid-binding protein